MIISLMKINTNKNKSQFRANRLGLIKYVLGLIGFAFQTIKLLIEEVKTNKYIFLNV